MIRIGNLSKSFALPKQGGAMIAGAALTVAPGECVGLIGQSGAGKSTLMRMIRGNSLAAGGGIRVDGVDVATATPRQIIALRRDRLGHVSQFLRVVPRVPTPDVVAEPPLALGTPADAAWARLAARLSRLTIPERLWPLSPTTFSGGEQQRVNIARGFAPSCPALLLDEPAASLDGSNRKVVLRLIKAARDRLCDRLVDVTGFTPKAAS